MHAFRKMNRFIVLGTCLITGIISIFGLIFFDGAVFLSLWAGALMGLVGYWMIYSMVQGISMENGKSQGMKSYVARYGLYALVLMLMAICDLSVLACLIGYLIHKATILLYSIERKG